MKKNLGRNKQSSTVIIFKNIVLHKYIIKIKLKNKIDEEMGINLLYIVIRFLGYLASEFSLYRIRVFIEKKKTNELIRDISFKMILSGLATQRIYKIP